MGNEGSKGSEGPKTSASPRGPKGADPKSPTPSYPSTAPDLSWRTILEPPASVEEAEVYLANLLDHKLKPGKPLPKKHRALDLSRYALLQLPARLEEFGSETKVEALDLSFNRLAPSLPKELGGLVSLTRLNVGSNQLCESLTCLASLVNLKHLNVSWNFLPDINFVTSLTALESLDAQCNRFAAPLPALTALTALETLVLSEASIAKFPVVGDSNARLASIVLANTVLEDVPDFVGDLPALTALDLGDNRPMKSCTAKLNNIKTLTYLNLSGGSLTALPSEWRKTPIPALTDLNVSMQQFTEFPVEVCAHTSLTRLAINGFKFTSLPTGFTQLTKLIHLRLRYNLFATFPEPLWSLAANLVSMDLSGNDLTALDTKRFAQEFTNLQLLDLAYNKFKSLDFGEGAKKNALWSKKMPKLVGVFLNGNPFDDSKILALQNQREDSHRAIRYYIQGKELPTTPKAPEIAEDARPDVPAPNRPYQPSAGPVINIPAEATTLSPAVLRSKILGLIFGAAVGDAVGLATEFFAQPQSQYSYGNVDPLTYDRMSRDRHRARWHPGDFTDDSDQSILILQNVLRHKCATVDEVEFAMDLLTWSEHGFPEVGDLAGLGIGATVGRVLEHAQFLKTPHQAAEEVWENGGRKIAPNGAVMRTAILGVPWFYDDKKRIENTLKICKVTHADPRCKASCLAVTCAIAQLLRGKTDVDAIIEESYKEAVKELKEKAHIDELRAYMTELSLPDMKLDDRPTIGYTYKSLGSAFYAFKNWSDFRSGILKLTMASGDSDTNAVVAGALLGCKLGFEALPRDWIQGLIHSTWLARFAHELLTQLGLGEPEAAQAAAEAKNPVE